MQYQGLLNALLTSARIHFDTALSGVYLHGSLAMGCFHPEKSDLDLLFVIREGISDAQKLAFMEDVVQLNELAPTKGIEMSVVREEYCREFVYPTPYELHFSGMHLDWFRRDPKDYVARMRGVDPDLAAHFTITREYGITLFGPDVKEMFDMVPREAYIDSIWQDVAGAAQDILNDPMYVILNLCRVAAYLEEGRITSKKTGGQWLLEQISAQCVPEFYVALVKKALYCYENGEEMAVEEAAVGFAEYMLKKIKEARRQKDV